MKCVYNQPNPFCVSDQAIRDGSQLDGPFPKISELACCKYVGGVIEYGQYYLVGVFYQSTPERWLSSLLYSTSLLESRLPPFILAPPNSSHAWAARLPAWSAQSAISPRLASMGTTNERSPICPVRAPTRSRLSRAASSSGAP